MLSVVSQFLFGNSNVFSSAGQSVRSRNANCCKDKSLCFDLRPQELELDGGEQLIGCFFPIEDVKGNPEEYGFLKITNLRLIWICCKKKRVSLSIGWRTVLLAYENNLKDALNASTSSLFVLTKYESTKYEFVFKRHSASNDLWMGGNQDKWQALAPLNDFHQERPTLISHLSPMYLDDPFEVVFKVWQSHKQTHLFRHCRPSLLLNSQGEPLISDQLHDMKKLPDEEISKIFKHISLKGTRYLEYRGNLVLTNVRLIWVEDSRALFTPEKNFSIPWIRVHSLKLKEPNKIVVSTYDYLISSTHIVFKVDKSEREVLELIKSIFRWMRDLHSSSKLKPRFGPESCEEILNFMSHLKPTEYFLMNPINELSKLENLGPQMSVNSGKRKEDDLASTRPDFTTTTTTSNSNNLAHDEEVERTESELNRYGTNLLRYLNEQPIEHDNELTYSTELGLAIEKPINGMDIRRIWQIDL